MFSFCPYDPSPIFPADAHCIHPQTDEATSFEALSQSSFVMEPFYNLRVDSDCFHLIESIFVEHTGCVGILSDRRRPSDLMGRSGL